MLDWFDLNTLSDISRDIAQVLFASMFINQIVTGDFNSPVVIYGFLFSLGFWFFSLLLKHKING
jgi:hypothetical protein